MDKVSDLSPLSSWSGSQLRLGLMEEGKKETLLEDLKAFTGLFPIYLFRRVRSVLSVLFRILFSGFTLTGQFKVWLSRLFGGVVSDFADCDRRPGEFHLPEAASPYLAQSLHSGEHHRVDHRRI